MPNQLQIPPQLMSPHHSPLQSLISLATVHNVLCILGTFILPCNYMFWFCLKALLLLSLLSIFSQGFTTQSAFFEPAWRLKQSKCWCLWRLDCMLHVQRWKKRWVTINVFIPLNTIQWYASLETRQNGHYGRDRWDLAILGLYLSCQEKRLFHLMDTLKPYFPTLMGIIRHWSALAGVFPRLW